MALIDYTVTVDVGAKVVGQGILQESVTPNSPLGTKLSLNDGRDFIYCKNGGTALTTGLIVSTPAWVSTEANLATDNDTGGLGTTDVLITTGSTVSADTYAEGYVSVDTSTGAGTFYKIKTHPTLESAEGTFTLYDPIVVAWGDSTTVSLVKNPYNGVILSVASGGTETGAQIGVPLIPVTASYFFWAQTRGICNLFDTGNLAIGVPAMRSTTAGATIIADSTFPEIAVRIHDGVTTEYRPSMLYL